MKSDKKPKFIPGIYNHCDRWCERCHLTAHCRVFADQKKMEREFEKREARAKAADEAAHDLLNRKFWGDLKKGFDNKLSKLLIEPRPSSTDPFPPEPDDGNPFDIDEDEIKADEAAEAWKPKRVRPRTEMNVIAELYSARSTKFLNAEFPKFMKSGPQKRDKRDKTGRDIDDALDVICWYLHFISVKLLRACKVDVNEEELEDTDEQTQKFESEDANLSARLALEGILRSMQAWLLLREHYPQHRGVIIRQLARLYVLRRDIDEKFPDAKKAKLWIDVKAPK